MKKRAFHLLPLVLALVLIFSALPLNAIAASGDAMTVKVAEVSARPGDTVDVNIELSNNPGIASLVLDVDYDDVLTLTNVRFNTESLAGANTTAKTPYTNPQRLSLASPTTNLTYNGVFATLTFTVSEDAADNYVAKVNVSYDENNVFDFDLNNLPLNVQNGQVNVYHGIPGDINGDRVVNNKDAVLLFRYVAGWDIEVETAALDINGDGSVNNKDAVTLFRYVAGWDVTIGPVVVHTHTMEAVEAKEATCAKEGNVAYWHCTSCGKYFSNANGTAEISLQNTVIPMKEHTVVIDPAVPATYESEGLTAGKHCSVCGTIIEPQEKIEKLVKEEYNITYNYYAYQFDGGAFLEGVEITNPNLPEKATYTKNEGVANLYPARADGYRFIGWFDSTGSNANEVTAIQKGTTGDIELFAHWELVEYTIQFNSPLAPVNSIKYTVDKGATLSNPDWFGYTFIGWTDENGVVVDRIPKGTSGNITLKANWTSIRNQTVPVSNLGEPLITEDTEKGNYLFQYEIGRIENVPLYTIRDFGNRSGITVTESVSESLNVSKTSADTVANMISEATTKSDSWTLSEEWNESTTISEEHSSEVAQEVISASIESHEKTGNWTISSGNGGTTSRTTEHGTSAKISAELEAGVGAGPYSVKAKMGAEEGITTNDSKTNTRNWNTNAGYSQSSKSSGSTSNQSSMSSKVSNRQGQSQTKEHNKMNSSTSSLSQSTTNSREYTSALSYATGNSSTSVKEYTNANAPVGFYRLVAAGTIHVYAVVGYNIATKSYFVYTYNVLDDEVKDFVDYSKSTSNYDDYQNGVLPFEVPYEVNEYIDDVLFTSDGLEVDLDSGHITGYTGEATTVYIPEYIPVDNGDGTSSAIKVTGIDASAFSGNTTIQTVKFNKYITEIPENAFKGCQNLKNIEYTSLTAIGKDAFYGCYSLEEFTVSDSINTLGENAFLGVMSIKVNAINSAVAENAIKSGARKIVLTDMTNDGCLNNRVIDVPNSTDYFELNGLNKEYSQLFINSDAATTVINGFTINDDAGIPIKTGSTTVTLNRVTINASDFAAAFKENAIVSLFGNINLNTKSENALLCKSINLKKASTSVSSKLNVNGNIMICGEITDTNSMLNCTGEIIHIDETTFNNLLDESVAWVLASEVPAGAHIISEKWTYDMTSNVTSNQSSLEGYTLYDTTSEPVYGNWSGYTTTYAKPSSTLDVQTRTTYRYCAFTCPYGCRDPYSTPCDVHGYSPLTWRAIWDTRKGTSLSSKATLAGVTGKYYTYAIDGTKWWFEQDGYSDGQGGTGQPSRTEYRTRTITMKYTYYYTRTESLESYTEIVPAEGISNIQRWVRYV